MSNIHPDEFVEEISQNISTRKKRSIEILHKICKDQHDRGSKDFSIPTISRISVNENGPSEQTIRNKDGADYRALLNCWATYTDGSTKKSKEKQEFNATDEILAGISDPTIRALVGVIIAENRKLKGENSLLKQTTKLTIDMRSNPSQNLPGKELLGLEPEMKILPTEVLALRHSISNEFLDEQGWTTDDQGRIKYKGRPIYKAGYVTAIKKVLSNYPDEK